MLRYKHLEHRQCPAFFRQLLRHHKGRLQSHERVKADVILATERARIGERACLDQSREIRLARL